MIYFFHWFLFNSIVAGDYTFYDFIHFKFIEVHLTAWYTSALENVPRVFEKNVCSAGWNIP